METFKKSTNTPCNRTGSWAKAARFLLALTICLGWAAIQAVAQTGGDGAVTGTVTDATGAVVAGATVSATNVETNVVTTRETTSAGYYNVAPLIPGNYTITVSASGFEVFKQKNMVIDAMHVSGLNVIMKPGSESVTVTVTAAPPALETTNAVLGGTIDSDVYMDLPLMVSGNQQRDITQFSNLLPGAQLNPGGRSSIIGGTAQRLGELYLDGLPLTTASQQGDNRPIFNLVPMESIDQIQVVTSSFSAEYQGAGLENYTLKSGTSKYHGTFADFVRNTAFDTWGFSSPIATKMALVNGALTKVAVGKPVDHQNELSASVGGPISIPHLFSGRDKLFFQATYDKTHARSGANPVSATIPTALMQAGNFSEVLTAYGYKIYDPTTLATCTANSTNGVCRYQYGYGPGATKGAYGNPVLLGTNSPVNVIPSTQLSPIAQYMQKFLPSPLNSAVTGNYAGGYGGGYDNWLYAGRIDYNLTPKQRLSMAVTGGNRHTVPYVISGTTPVLPVPYLQGTLATVAGHIADMTHTYAITPNLVNQFKYGFVNFGGPPVKNATEGIEEYKATTAGITGLPSGQASDEFPTSIFGGSNAQSQWANAGSGATATSVSETYTIVDNLQWVKGKHAITAGLQWQWLEIQASSADGASTPLTLNWATSDTAAVAGTSYTASTGYSYASYMLGAVDSSSTTMQTVAEVGARYRPIAPYFQDDWKITPKLTLNLGLRWDYIPPYHESQDRWSFLDATVDNPITGNKGALMFAGNHGGSAISIGKSTPVETYWKNWGPRLGFAYSLNDKTVLRGGYGLLYTHGGGTGGNAGAGVGTGQTGFNTPISFSLAGAGSNAAPAFYLNNNTSFGANQNSTWGGKGYTLPSTDAAIASAQSLNVGNYTGATAQAGTTAGYADPYLSGRAPEFSFYNFGIQRELSQNITISVNYSGSESHFIPGAATMRGIQSGGIDPTYMQVLGSGGPGLAYSGTSNLGALTQKATPAEVALVQAAMPQVKVPYTDFTTFAASSNAYANKATIGQMLKWMPQFSGTTDTWGINVANANYHSAQISLAIRQTHGLTLNVNYTYSKQMDDAGTNRSGFAIPASMTRDGKAWARNRIDYSLSTLSAPQNLSIYGVYKLPFGKGGIGANNFFSRAALSGWSMSNIMTYVSGMPLTLSSTACSSYSVGQGTCMPDLNPNYTGGRKGIRINGKWGHGVTAATLGTRPFVNGADPSVNGGNHYLVTTTPGSGGQVTIAGVTTQIPCTQTVSPFCNAGYNMIGNAPRTAPYGLRAPNTFRLTSGVRRSFDISDKAKFIFAVDCQNVTNAVTFGINAGNLQIPTAVNTATFGTLTYASADSRDFQFSGRISF